MMTTDTDTAMEMMMTSMMVTDMARVSMESITRNMAETATRREEASTGEAMTTRTTKMKEMMMLLDLVPMTTMTTMNGAAEEFTTRSTEASATTGIGKMMMTTIMMSMSISI